MIWAYRRRQATQPVCEGGSLVCGEAFGERGFIVEQLADYPLDQLMALGSKGDQDAAARRGGRLAGDQACGFGTGQPLKDLAAQWNANIAANLLTAVLTTSALRDRLGPGGSVINVGSIGAEYASTSYGAAKAALAAWSAGLSAELAPTGVTSFPTRPPHHRPDDPPQRRRLHHTLNSAHRLATTGQIGAEQFRHG
ncbi:SDR family NAD(P)-dependent oxidoreductase [Nocardia nepalensis]|uniref:SDR family NAD(P)-dependent oxidoreductase n=1 Tax=Nocardia nepalensis TaxID=3375448 RepID=UPI003B680F1D